MRRKGRSKRRKRQSTDPRSCSPTDICPELLAASSQHPSKNCQEIAVQLPIRPATTNDFSSSIMVDNLKNAPVDLILIYTNFSQMIEGRIKVPVSLYGIRGCKEVRGKGKKTYADCNDRRRSPEGNNIGDGDRPARTHGHTCHGCRNRYRSDIRLGRVESVNDMR